MQIQTANYDLVTTWQGGMASRTRCQSMTGDKRQSHVIDSDEPVALGGEGRAPGPQDLMLAAFNACMTTGSSFASRGAPYRCFASVNALRTAASQARRKCCRVFI